MNIIITGGAGFIGSSLIKQLLDTTKHLVLNIDKVTYASNPLTIEPFKAHPRYFFKQVCISNHEAIHSIITEFKPDVIFHLAAESHVDRSIDSPDIFLKTNISGTFNLLDSALKFWDEDESNKDNKRFIHVSTDEVFGSLKADEEAFRESSPYSPNSPYAASKAASDHLVRAWFKTYKLPAIITNCSNNYGPFQHPEKLIPHTILNAIKGSAIPLYGNGLQRRDWLHVNDHANALIAVMKHGATGESYNIGANNELSNLDLVTRICTALDSAFLTNSKPANLHSFADLITHVQDRPGHDVRYSMNPTKINNSLNWHAKTSLDKGIETTISWYLNNSKWLEYFLEKNYKSERLGNY